jgi:hypothetical protein
MIFQAAQVPMQANLTCDFGSSGAEGIRTPDPLHAMGKSDVHRHHMLARDSPCCSMPHGRAWNDGQITAKTMPLNR